ncbi:MAG: mismatch repair protein MutT [Candidatus Saccharibacteria bacterium]|nr:mismatch repair protein MutT [Candidatus Saccharibacteria bacterium]
MAKQAAGILVFRVVDAVTEVLLVHLGGPIWGHQDWWSIPKGELEPSEDHLAAAYREFEEEVGMPPPAGELIELGEVVQPGGKRNFIWAVEGTLDLADFSCNTFTMEWPPRSGVIAEFPENDRAEWFDLDSARRKLFPHQVAFIDRLAAHLKS